MTREEKLLKIFEIADKNRNLEIKLYWERSKYFFGFITALLASVLGLAAFLIYKYESLNNSNYNALILGSIGLVILSTLLLFFSVGFWLSHKASKFWQENWENILGVLERKIFGDDFVYSVILFRKELVENKEKNNKEEIKDNKDNDKKNLGNKSEKKLEFKHKYLFHPTKPFFISPSKINANLSIVIIIASYLLFLFSFSWLFAVTNRVHDLQYIFEVYLFLTSLSFVSLGFYLLISLIKNIICQIESKICKLVTIISYIILFTLLLTFILILIFGYFGDFSFLVFKCLVNNPINNLFLTSFISINILILNFIENSLSDFAKKREEQIKSYKHKYLITFNIIDDENYKDGNFNLKGLHKLEKIKIK